MATPRGRRATSCRWTTLQARSQRVALRPDPRLRPLLTHRYESFAGSATTRREFVIPAGVVTPLIIDVEAAPRRPAGLVYGPNGCHTVVDSACPPAYIETCLAPLGAYRVLGPAVAEMSESIVGLEDSSAPTQHGSPSGSSPRRRGCSAHGCSTPSCSTAAPADRSRRRR